MDRKSVMAETKLVVPEGMLKAVQSAERGNPHFETEDALRTALLWLSESPIVPTDAQFQEMDRYCSSEREGWFTHPITANIIEAWLGRMFFVPCPLEERVTVEKWIHDPNLWIVLHDGWNSSHIPGFKDKKDAEIYRLGLIQKLKEEKEG